MGSKQSRTASASRGEHRKSTTGEADRRDRKRALLLRSRGWHHLLGKGDGVSRVQNDSFFLDTDFPANDEALYKQPQHKGIKWARPKDLTPGGTTPCLLLEGASSYDFIQGTLSDCWFLAACVAVSKQRCLMDKIIPGNQPLSGDGYTGAVYFRLWHFGRWVEVWVDDLLPVKDGQLIYSRCSHPAQFWVSLLEKAYAKLHGSYEALAGGNGLAALIDLTGGLAERHELSQEDPELFHHMLHAHASGALMTCTHKEDLHMSSGETRDRGLTEGHAYAITCVTRFEYEGRVSNLLVVHDPWGSSRRLPKNQEESGDWLNGLPADVLDCLMLAPLADGELWVTFTYFCQQFSDVTICTVIPDSDSDKEGDLVSVFGEWLLGQSAGGSRNDPENFATNPQYHVTLHKPEIVADPFHESQGKQGRCSLHISLMQEPGNWQRPDGLLQIGFVLYKADGCRRLQTADFRSSHFAAKSGPYFNLREVGGRFELPPGSYVIVPSTFQANMAARFLVRIWSQVPFEITGPL